MDTASLERAREELGRLCGKVGLAAVEDLPRLDGDLVEPPPATALWRAPYAGVLLWPCSEKTVEGIARVAQEGESWLDAVLSATEAETGGRVIDGYLVLAVAERPPEDLDDDIRRLELSPRVCRKHLIWPARPEDRHFVEGAWSRIADVTVVGLPDIDVEATGELYSPDLDPEADALFEELHRLSLPGMLRKDGLAP